LAAILAADVVGYARLMADDERRTVAALDVSREVFGAQIEAHHGRVVDMTGDSVLAIFDSVIAAVNAAVAVQTELANAFAAVPDQQRMRFRIGVHLGDVLERDDGTVYGDGVNITARLEALAEPGGIAVSDAVFGAVSGKVAACFEDQGERAVKNIPRPLKTHYVRADVAVVAKSSHVTSDSRRALPERPAIAVLPFSNMSGDTEQDYFADGMVDDIITALSRFKDLLVIARNSSFVYKGQNADIQQVARDLGVRYVLEGSVRKAGHRVRITGQLIDAATRAHLWADHFDGELEDVFALQDHITESVVGALVPTLRRAEIERARRKPPASLDAYDYVLRALPRVLGNAVLEARTALGLLDEALRLDPEYAYTHALVAIVHGQIYRSATEGEREASRLKAVAHARRALAIGSDDSATLASAGFVLLIADQDVAGARAALDKAVELNSNSALAFGRRALVLAMVGDAERAMEDAKHALRLSPLDPGSYVPQIAIAVAHVARDEYDEARVWAHKAIAANPRYPISYAFLIVVECARGNTAEARSVLNRLAGILPGFTPAILSQLFDVFSDPLRSNSLAILRRAGLIPECVTVGS
jgi:TolB-like protein/class 3 adenylate cyclase/Tfp pilus assembly protein PilF